MLLGWNGLKYSSEKISILAYHNTLQNGMIMYARVYARIMQQQIKSSACQTVTNNASNAFSSTGSEAVVMSIVSYSVRDVGLLDEKNQ